MTDLESQLRDCLSRHATDAETPIDLLSQTRARSRQLSRRRSTATVAAIVPITAAVVVGSMALVGSPAGPDHLHVRPVATTTVSPATSGPATARQAIGCKSGTVPNLHAGRRTEPGRHSETAAIRLLTEGDHLGIKGYYILGGLKPFLIDGRPPGAHSVSVVATTAQHKRFWAILRNGSDRRSGVYAATLLGCVPEPASATG